MAKWNHKLDGIKEIEDLYSEGHIDLQEMCLRIYNLFVQKRWIDSPDGETKRIDFLNTEDMDDLDNIVHGDLHTIAFQDSIYEEGDRPQFNPDDYDLWKEDLYDWADVNRVWISPYFS